jgi:hypothetical protein
MKTNEFRIGNFILDEGMICPIIEINENTVLFRTPNDIVTFAFPEDIDGVPLSNEWFERFDWKNGFHKGLLMRVGTQINLFGKIMPIDYVHELQNLYYTLHKEEL